MIVARIAFIVALLISAEAQSAGTGCQGNPKLTGACRWLHGTVLMSGDVLWVFDVPGKPHAHFFVRPAPGGEQLLPGALSRFESEIPPNVLTGDFLVCPIPEQESQFERGFLKFICIGSGRSVEEISGRAWEARQRAGAR